MNVVIKYNKCDVPESTICTTTSTIIIVVVVVVVSIIIISLLDLYKCILITIADDVDI